MCFDFPSPEVPIIVGDAERDQILLSTSLEHIFYFTEKCLRTLIAKYFCGGCFGRAITYPGCCGTFVGVGVKSVLEKESVLYQALVSIEDPKKAQLHFLSNSQLLSGGAFHIRYTRDWNCAMQLLSALIPQPANSLIERLGYSFGTELATTSKIADDFYQANEWFKKQQRTPMTLLHELRAKFQAESQLTHLRAVLDKNTNEINSLRSHLTGIEQLKIFRLRKTLQQRPVTMWNAIKAAYLLIAIITPEIIRSRVRVPFGKLIKLVRERKSSILNRQLIVSKTIKMWNDRPLLSVIIPCYNYGKFIHEALQSLYSQTFQNFEILIVDCSDDVESKKIIGNISHPKVKVHYRDKRYLLGNNRNYGIQLAQGKYVCCIDPDDTIEPTYFEKALYILEQGYFDIVSASLREFDQAHGEWILNPRPPPRQILLLNQISVIGIYRRKLWEELGGFFDYGTGKEYVYEDWEFWIRATLSGARIMNIREILMNYRIHGNNMSKAQNLMSLEVMRERMKERNTALFSEANIIKAEKQNNTKISVSNGTINLLPDTKNYLPNPKSILIVLPYAIIGGAAQRALAIGKFLQTYGFSISVLITNEAPVGSKSNRVEFDKAFGDTFDLPNFLGNQLDWLDFTKYLLSSRKISSCLLAGSQFFYDHLEKLKDFQKDLKVIDLQFNCDIHFTNNRVHSSYIDVSVAENRDVLVSLEEQRKNQTEKFFLIENGVDIEALRNKFLNKSARPKQIPSDKFIVGFLGRLSCEKGPDLFIDIAILCANNPRLFFVIAGPGEMRSQIEDQIVSYGIEGRILVMDAVDSTNFFQWIDLLIVPSRIDGRPNVILEAMALGIPCVASKIGGIPSIISDQKYGYLCDKEDVESFASCIEELANEPAKYAEISNNIKIYAQNLLDDTVLLRKFLPIFEVEKSTANSSVFNPDFLKF